MDKKVSIEDLEFENPVEIRKFNKEKSNKGCNRILLLFVLLLLVTSTFSFYRYFLMKKNNSNLKQEVKKLSEQLKEKEKQINEITSKLSEIKSAISKKGNKKTLLISNIKQLKNELKKQKIKIKRLQTSNNNLKKELQRLSRKTRELKGKNRELKNTIAVKEKEISAQKNKIKELENRVTQMEQTLSNLRQTFNMESSASKKLISELIGEQKKNEKLLKENLKLKETVKELSNRVKRLKTVEEGDMVPSSDLVIPAKPLISEKVRVKSKGIFSKVKGFVVVNALIDESGIVKNAYFVFTDIPENKIDRGTLINKALTILKKWKFSPPMYRGNIPVKNWQPVIMPVEGK